MIVKFLHEFGGRETGEIHYPAEFEVELEDDVAENLVSRGICQQVITPESAVQVEEPKSKSKGKSK